MPALPITVRRSAALLEAYATIERTIHLGSAKAVGISELINRRLLAPTPPKPLEMVRSSCAVLLFGLRVVAAVDARGRRGFGILAMS